MSSTLSTKSLGFLLTIVVAIPLALAACLSVDFVPPTIPDTPIATPVPAATVTDSRLVWLLQQTPYPFTTPLPPTKTTVLDGIYTKFDPQQSDHDTLPAGGVTMPHPKREGVFWLKPVPYPLEGGAWILRLDKGVFRVYHETTGWRTLGSYTVSEGRIDFFNDPSCYYVVGSYTWELEAGQLTLQAIDDECDGRVLGGGGLRVMNFTSHPWKLDSSSHSSE